MDTPNPGPVRWRAPDSPGVAPTFTPKHQLLGSWILGVNGVLGQWSHTDVLRVLETKACLCW